MLFGSKATEFSINYALLGWTQKVQAVSILNKSGFNS